MLPTLLAAAAVALAIAALIVAIRAGSDENGDATPAPVATGNDAPGASQASAELGRLRSDARATGQGLDEVRESVAGIRRRLTEFEKHLDDARTTGPQGGEGAPQPAPDSGSGGEDGGAPEAAPPEGGSEGA